MIQHRSIDGELNTISGEVVDCAMKVHRALGPGLLESAYEACLVREFELREIRVKRQVAIPVSYEGLQIEAGYRLDLLVEDRLIVELKAVEQLLPVHDAQLLTYLKLLDLRLGLLINFNVALLKKGIRRIIR